MLEYYRYYFELKVQVIFSEVASSLFKCSSTLKQRASRTASMLERQCRLLIVCTCIGLTTVSKLALLLTLARFVSKPHRFCFKIADYNPLVCFGNKHEGNNVLVRHTRWFQERETSESHQQNTAAHPINICLLSMWNEMRFSLVCHERNDVRKINLITRIDFWNNCYSQNIIYSS